MVFVKQKMRITGKNMEIELSSMDAEALRNLYVKAAAELKDALLNGASWQEVQQHRKFVTQLSMALHTRIAASSNPAEQIPRNEGRGAQVSA